jgi:hypothetical protein
MSQMQEVDEEKKKVPCLVKPVFALILTLLTCEDLAMATIISSAINI